MPTSFETPKITKSAVCTDIDPARRTRIKVQEAKETPSVKVLDPPDVPDKRSFPPRLLIVVSGAISGLMAYGGGVFWVLGKRAWDQTAEVDPQKVFAQEVIHTVQAHLPLGSNEWF